MNKHKREKIVNEIVDDFNEHQVHDSYWFEHSKTHIEWWPHQEAHLILFKDKTWDSCEPRHLYMYIEDLHAKDLKEYQEENK